LASALPAPEDAHLLSFPHFDHDSRPTAQIFAGASHDRESRQHVAVTSGHGAVVSNHTSLCGISACTEPTFEEIMDSSFAW
jgi:hypothetical protein